MCILDTFFFFLVSLFISMFLKFIVYSLNFVLCLHLAINSLLIIIIIIYIYIYIYYYFFFLNAFRSILMFKMNKIF